VQLDPWNGHLTVLIKEDEQLKKSSDQKSYFSPESLAYVAKVKSAAEEVGLPIACLAVDGAHIYEPTPEARALNRASAYRWMDVAHKLNAEYVRIDTGGTPDMPDEMFNIILEGYHDLLNRAKDMGLKMLMENHWGANNVPDNIIKILEALDGLGLLFDTHNFAKGTQLDGWTRCAKYARSVHVKTFEFDAKGVDPTVDLPKVVGLLRQAGYDGAWGIESVPKDGDEYGAVEKTKAWLTRILEG